MTNKYDWGLYTGRGGSFNFRDKDTNTNKYVDEMLNKSLIMFRYENLPESIPQIELEKMLQVGGYACFTEVEGEYYVFKGGLGGVPDVYGRPSQIIINNPSLKFNKTLNIGEECIIVKNDYLSLGVIDLYTKYSTMLVENDITMILSNYNKRIDNIISVTDDNTGESARIYLNKVEDGELGYIMENKLYDSLKSHNTRGNSSSTLGELIQYHQYLKGSMMNEIGLNTAFNMKKERLITSEIEETTDGLYPLVDNMLECREKALELINEKYGLDIKVELNSSWGNRKKKEQLLLNELETEIETEEETIEETGKDDIIEIEETIEEKGEETEVETIEEKVDETTEELKEVEEEEEKEDEEKGR